MKNFVLSFLLAAFTLSVNSQQTDTTLQRIVERYRQFLLHQDTSKKFNRAFPVAQNGSWSDVTYTVGEAGRWSADTHLRRTRMLAMAWASADMPTYHSHELMKEIKETITYWCNHRFRSSNWWHNEIGVPQLFRDIIILTRDSLGKEVLQQAMSIFAQYKVNGTGANLVWSADLGLHYAALTNNYPLAKKCRDTIVSAIVVTTAEGVQPDYSFHQHGKRLQMYHYGGAFLLDNMRLAWELAGGSLAYPARNVWVLTDFALIGWQWMARGVNTVPGTIDRAVSREGDLRKPDIRQVLYMFDEINPDSTRAFHRLRSIQDGRQFLEGYRYYPFSDFTTLHRQQFSFFLKTTSTRTLLSESINGENLKGRLLNIGDSYFIMDGSEYYNLMPVWDWSRLPGITSFDTQGKIKIVQQAFCGNVSDGHNGAASMKIRLEDSSRSLSLRKFWVSHENVTISLINGTGNTSAFTVMDQSRLQGDVLVNDKRVKQVHNHKPDRIKSIYHHHLLYEPLYSERVSITMEQRSGSWQMINQSESARSIKVDVFMPVILHQPGNFSSGYAVTFMQEMANVSPKKNWTIIRNDSSCQAVNFNDGSMFAVFYSKGVLKINRKSIEANRPCLMQEQSGTYWVSDPLHKGGEIKISINGRIITKQVPSDGSSITIN
jgi:chondroitin AC lyase